MLSQQLMGTSKNLLRGRICQFRCSPYTGYVSAPHCQLHPLVTVFRSSLIHVVAHAITKVVADMSNFVPPIQEIQSHRFGQGTNDLQCLPKHPNQRTNVNLVLRANMVTETSRLLAVKNHQFR